MCQVMCVRGHRGPEYPGLGGKMWEMPGKQGLARGQSGPRRDRNPRRSLPPRRRRRITPQDGDQAGVRRIASGRETGGPSHGAARAGAALPME